MPDGISPKNEAWEQDSSKNSRLSHGGKESIVFFIDIHKEEFPGVVWPTLNGSNGNLTLELFKQCVSLIVLTQARISRNNEFCLCVLLDGAILCSEFTSDISQLLDQVYALEGQEPFSELDMASVFNILQERKQTVAVSPKNSTGDNLVRGILFYARSHAPKFVEGEEAWRELSRDPDVVLDAIFVHSTHGSKEKAQEIFDFFIDLDIDNSGLPYTFESVLNPKKVLRCAAQLAANGRQRPKQGLLVNDLTKIELTGLTDSMDTTEEEEDIPVGIPVQ